MGCLWQEVSEILTYTTPAGSEISLGNGVLYKFRPKGVHWSRAGLTGYDAQASVLDGV